MVWLFILPAGTLLHQDRGMKTWGDQTRAGAKPTSMHGKKHHRTTPPPGRPERSEAEKGMCTGRGRASKPGVVLTHPWKATEQHSYHPGTCSLMHLSPFIWLIIFPISHLSVSSDLVSCVCFHTQAQCWNVWIAKELLVPKAFFQWI